MLIISIFLKTVLQTDKNDFSLIMPRLYVEKEIFYIHPWKNNRIQCTPVTQLPHVRGQRGPALIKWVGLISVYIPAIATLSHYQYYHIPRTRLWFSDHRSRPIRPVSESQANRKQWITNRRNKISAVASTLMNKEHDSLEHMWGCKEENDEYDEWIQSWGPIISQKPGA